MATSINKIGEVQLFYEIGEALCETQNVSAWRVCNINKLFNYNYQL